MSTATYVKQQKARIQFFGLYFVSLVLIFIVVSAFWKNTKLPAQSKADDKAESALYYIEADTLLHKKLQAVDAAYLKSDNKNTTYNGDIKLTSDDLRAAMDSINNLSSVLADGPKRQMLMLVMSGFKTTLESRPGVADNISQLPAKTEASQENRITTEMTHADDHNLEELKQILVDKENKIAALESQMQKTIQDKDRQLAAYQEQLKQKGTTPQTVTPVVQNTSGASDAEWRQKYGALKANYEKALARENDLKASYQTVIDDNRRLLNQLKSLKN